MLKHILTLQDFEVHDYIANDETECWKADQNSQSGGLYDKIAAAVCRAGPFPFSGLVPFVVPPTWLRLADVWSATLISLVKSDPQDFSHGNISAQADTLPASEEDLDKLFEVLKGYYDGSWEYVVTNDSLQQPADNGSTVSAQSSETP